MKKINPFRGQLDLSGVGFGEYGEGYVIIALGENEKRILQAVRNTKSFSSDHYGLDELNQKAS